MKNYQKLLAVCLLLAVIILPNITAKQPGYWGTITVHAGQTLHLAIYYAGRMNVDGIELTTGGVKINTYTYPSTGSNSIPNDLTNLRWLKQED